MNSDAHLDQKEKITQTDHPFKKEPFHNCLLVIPLLLVLRVDPLIITVVVSILAMDIIPMDTTLMANIPMDTILMDIIPMDTTLMDNIPMNTTLMDTIFIGTTPMVIIPTDTILMVTTPMDITPTVTIPMDMISLTMDRVTHPPIAKNSKVSIIGAMVHHMDTQEKEVQVKDSFLSTNEKSDMSIDYLH